MFERLLKVAIAIGAVIDAGVAIVSLFFQQSLQPLFDIPLKDPALTTIAGGEYVVVTFVYVLLLVDLRRFSTLLWLAALDQAFAAILPALEIARHNVPATAKTIGPIPFNLLLAIVYVVGARLRTRTRPALTDTADS